MRVAAKCVFLDLTGNATALSPVPHPKAENVKFINFTEVIPINYENGLAAPLCLGLQEREEPTTSVH